MTEPIPPHRRAEAPPRPADAVTVVPPSFAVPETAEVRPDPSTPSSEE